MGSTIQVKDVHVRMTIPLIDSDVRDGSSTTKIVGSFKEVAVGVKEVAENEVCVVVSLWVQVLDDAPCSVVVRTIESQPRSSSWKIVRLRIERKECIRICIWSTENLRRKKQGLSPLASDENSYAITVAGGATATRPTSTI
jgi:hypothetical protein